jgi:hypothetical protein
MDDLASYMNNVSLSIDKLPPDIVNGTLYQVCLTLLGSDDTDEQKVNRLLMLLDLSGITANLK